MHILKDLCSVCGGLIVVRYVEITDPQERRQLGSEMLVDGANCLECFNEIILPCGDYATFVKGKTWWLDD